MQVAIKSMHTRGLEPGQMQIEGDHQAFDLPDGRTVILFGDQSVNDITVIVNPDRPKSQRIDTSVNAITF